MSWRIILLSFTSVLGLVASQPRYFFNRGMRKMAEQHVVELLVVVDYSAYLKWYHKMSGDTAFLKKKNALNAIWKHYSSVIHGIDTIYRGLGDTGLKISVQPVDIQVVSTDGIVTSRNKFIASETALRAFYYWTQTGNKLPPFDHAMLITGYDLMENGDKSKSGRAYLGTMCTTRSVSVVENDFSFEIVQITAHELGHSLGAKHDGEENACSASDGFLMASVIEINSTNRWYLSPCSVEYIETLLSQLRRDRNLCLLHNKHEVEKNEGPTSSIHMGELYTPDQQCELIEGRGSYFCRDFYSKPEDYSHICTNIWCHVSNSTQNICNNYEGSDGYACGNKKVCEKGRCVFSNKRVESLDYCPQGDQPGIVWKNYTCAQLVFYEPEMCYDNNTRSRCCLSCTEINKGIPGCEFGDMSSWCRTHLITPMGCYKNENLCCGTCKMYKDPTRPSCPYGDKSLWCKTTLNPPFECYDNEDLCCATCANHFNESRVGCEYGDRSTWCETTLHPPYDCYKNSALCCGTCPQYYNPANPGCEFGDRSQWCETDLDKPYGCYLNSEFCCKTCESFLNKTHVGCEYGDKHKDCESLEYPVGCYNNDNICCGTCTDMKDSSQIGCEYGDKSTWCTTHLDPQADCPLNLDLCCGTCSLGGSGSERSLSRQILRDSGSGIYQPMQFQGRQIPQASNRSSPRPLL
ncbi:uncharacterized protein [Haliotis asinina]|uniref:uncharacterized protein n=1 Tax=Haliotis asinina TaxID=109174 RepID=UPI003531F83B